MEGGFMLNQKLNDNSCFYSIYQTPNPSLCLSLSLSHTHTHIYPQVYFPELFSHLFMLYRL